MKTKRLRRRWLIGSVGGHLKTDRGLGMHARLKWDPGACYVYIISVFVRGLVCCKDVRRVMVLLTGSVDVGSVFDPEGVVSAICEGEEGGDSRGVEWGVFAFYEKELEQESDSWGGMKG